MACKSQKLKHGISFPEIKIARYLTWVCELASFPAWGGADTKAASANRSTSAEFPFMTKASVGTDVGASMRSPIRLSPNKSTWFEVSEADSVNEDKISNIWKSNVKYIRKQEGINNLVSSVVISFKVLC